MGICCCVKVNNQASYNDNQEIKGQNQIYLFDKSCTKPNSTIYHKKKNQVQTISNNKDKRKKDQSQKKDQLFTEDKNEFFTYFVYSQQISQIIHRYILGQSSKFIQNGITKQTNSQQVSKNNSDFLNQTKKNLVDQGQHEKVGQENIIQIEQGLLQKYIEQGNSYMQSLNNFMKSQFVSQLRTLSIVRKDQQVPKETFFKLLRQLLHYKKEQTKQSETSLTLRWKSDIIAIINAQTSPQLKIPNKFNSALNENYEYAIQTEQINQISSIYDSWIKNSQKPFYLIKLELYSLINLLSETNKHAQKGTKIQKIIITLAEPTIKSLLTLQSASQLILQIDAKQISSPNGKTHRLQLIITPNTIIKFKTYPLESTLTLHAPQFLKFPYVNQIFPFTQLGQKIVQCARIGIRMQILSSNWSQTLQKLKLHAKSMLNQLQKIKRGENTWEHLNALQSSFGSISQNQSSFMSYNEKKTSFC